MIENESDPLRRIPTKHALAGREDIGSTLKAARVRRGLTLDAVVQQTRIPRRFIDALEANRLDEFPAQVYLRGFLKSYCEHLDLPFDEIWVKVIPPEPVAPQNATAAATTPPVSGTAKTRPSSPPSSVELPVLAGERMDLNSGVLAVLVAAALVVFLAFRMLAGKGATAPAPVVAPPPKALAPLTHPTVAKAQLLAVEDAWIRVDVDAAPVFEGRLPRGARMEWSPNKSLSVRTSAPSALKVTIDGVAKTFGAPAPTGEYRFDVR